VSRYIALPASSKNGWEYRYTHTIARDSLVSTGFTNNLAGIQLAYKVQNGAVTTTHSNGRPQMYRPVLRSVEVPTVDIYPPWRWKANHTIVDAIPILFHTQSQALSSAMGDVSRNFETFMELPGTKDLVASFLSYALAKPSIPKLSTPDLIAKLSKLWITYIFAIRPAYEGIRDIVFAVQKLPQSKYEYSYVKEGDNSSFLNLPQSMREYILQGIITSDQVKRFKFIAHSEVVFELDAAYVARVVSSMIEPTVRTGIVPEPRYIWAGLRYSFAVDWVLPMSSLIEDAQTYLASFTSPISTIGHSISIELEAKDGRVFNAYIRSENTTRPLDPHRDSWLQSGGVYKAAAIPLVVIAMLGFGRSSR